MGGSVKKAIVIGASTGIGRELSKKLAKEGYELGLVARSQEMLLSLQKEISTKSYVQQVDIVSPEAIPKIESLIQQMEGVELFVINAGTIYHNPDLDWQKEKETIDINVLGFAAMVNVAMRYFLKRGEGHIVGLSSISALRGYERCPAYNASKAFVSNYLEGIRQKAFKSKKKIMITDVKPGYVDTRLTKGTQGMFWVSTPEKAAEQIYEAIQHKRYFVYITHRWRLIAWVLKSVPRFLYDRFF
jgi:short-subunit dehydrogenase